MIGTLATWHLAPREYGYALDVVMPRLAGEGRPIVRCGVEILAAEVRQRLPRWAEEESAPVHDHSGRSMLGDVGRVALWLDPPAQGWQVELEALQAALGGGGTLLVIASRPLARLLPEWRGWPGERLGCQPGGIGRLRRALAHGGLIIEAEYGIHTVAAIGLNLLGRQAERFGRPDVGDRLHFAGRMRYCGTGWLATLATVALLVGRKEQA